MTLTPIKTFRGDDINTLNHQLWSTIYNKGSELTFGSVDEPKQAREIFAVIQVYGNALTDLYEGRLPKGWKFGQAANKIYIEMLKNPDKGDQPYTYGERLHKYPVCTEVTQIIGIEGEGENVRPIIGEPEYYPQEFNQLWEAHDQLKYYIKTGFQSNRICGVIWVPSDRHLADPPCFNWFQLRLSERNKVSLRILFRSNDAGNAVFANMGAVIRVFVDEVIKPAGGELEEVIWTATSEHIYHNDFDQVEALIGEVPEYMRRRL